jgi:Flagellar basal body-associated protein
MKKRAGTFFIIIIILAAAAAASYFLYMKGMLPIKPATNTANTQEKETTASLGEYTVNLDEPGYKRYISVKITAGYTGKNLGTEFTEKVAQINDIINGILRAKKIDDVNTPQKTDAVKKEIKDKLNAILQTGKIIDIYFNEILIK